MDFNWFYAPEHTDGVKTKSLRQLFYVLFTQRQQLVSFGFQIHNLVTLCQHVTPVGFICYMLTEHHFQHAALQATAYTNDWQCLHSALVYPACGYLGSSCNTYLHAGGIRQINDVILHAEFFTPGRLTACALLKMTLLRMNDAAVTLCQSLETGITITLIKTLVAEAIAVNAVNGAQVAQTHSLANQRIQRCA